MQILEEVRQHIKTSDVWNFVILVLFFASNTLQWTKYRWKL